MLKVPGGQSSAKKEHECVEQRGKYKTLGIITVTTVVI